jgi:hypothetical protein
LRVKIKAAGIDNFLVGLGLLFIFIQDGVGFCLRSGNLRCQQLIMMADC